MKDFIMENNRFKFKAVLRSRIEGTKHLFILKDVAVKDEFILIRRADFLTQLVNDLGYTEKQAQDELSCYEDTCNSLSEDWGDYLKIKPLHILQCTNEVDMYGKLIYEGDILQDTFCDTQTFEVNYSSQGFEFKIYTTEGKILSECPMSCSDVQFYIVGNRYEM